jgi:hypothetical protein
MISPVLFAGDVVPVVTMTAVGTALAIGVTVLLLLQAAGWIVGGKRFGVNV